MNAFEVFIISLLAVAALLISAVPGFFLVKKRLIGEESIKEFSRLLIYITQPALAIYTFQSTPFSKEKLVDIGLFMLLCVIVNVIMLAGSYFVLRRKYKDPMYRVMTVATTFGNCAFFGIPILEALFGAAAGELIIFTTVYALVMNLLGWTVGSSIISSDKRFVSLKQIVTNPALIGFTVAFTLYVTRIPLAFTIPGTDIYFGILLDIITIAGRMATPLSMLIMGMRLATMNVGSIFVGWRAYLTVLIKQCVMPLVAFALVYFLPISSDIKMTLYIICACPVASIVLNYAEMCGAGQKEGAGLVLLGTISSIATLPVMSMLINFLR